MDTEAECRVWYSASGQLLILLAGWLASILSESTEEPRFAFDYTRVDSGTRMTMTVMNWQRSTQPNPGILTIFAADEHFGAVLSPPHDVRLRISLGLALQRHVGALSHHHIVARLLLQD